MLYKLVDGQLVTPPSVWKGVVGYDKNLDLLEKDGWKPLIETGQGEMQQLIDRNDYIERHNYKKPYDYRALREAAYPSVGDMIDAICKAYDGDSDELMSLIAQRNIVKNTIKKTEE